MCDHPLRRDLVEGMLTYRIATPLISWIFHLPPVASLALPLVFSLCALIVVHRAVRVRSDRDFASVVTIGVACSSTFHYTNCYLGLPDSLTHLTSAITLIGSPLMVIGGVLIGCLNDERAVLALPFVALWRCEVLERLDWRSRRSWFAIVQAAAPLAIGLVIVSLVRHALKVGWIGDGIKQPALYSEMKASVREFRPWLESWGVWFANWLNGPGWLWLILLTPCISSRWRPAAVPAALLLLALVLVCASTFIVADVARSIGFAYPAAILAAFWVYRGNPKTAGNLMLLVAALQVITPAVWIYQKWQWLQFRPFPWELWLYLHRSPT